MEEVCSFYVANLQGNDILVSDEAARIRVGSRMFR